jgi:hypothetical protein
MAAVGDPAHQLRDGAEAQAFGERARGDSGTNLAAGQGNGAGSQTPAVKAGRRAVPMGSEMARDDGWSGMIRRRTDWTSRPLRPVTASRYRRRSAIVAIHWPVSVLVAFSLLSADRLQPFPSSRCLTVDGLIPRYSARPGLLQHAYLVESPGAARDRLHGRRHGRSGRRSSSVGQRRRLHTDALLASPRHGRSTTETSFS